MKPGLRTAPTVRLVETETWQPGCLFGPPARADVGVDHSGTMYFVLQMNVLTTDGFKWVDVPVVLFQPKEDQP